MRTLANDEEHYDVIRFVSLAGEAGQSWASLFEDSGCASSLRRIQGALKMTWAGRIDSAQQELEAVESDIEGTDLPASYSLLLGRWLHGVMAYVHYMAQDFEAAEAALLDAEASVRDSIVAEPILVPLAVHCADLRTQGARLARRRRRWSDMQTRLSEARGMYLGTVPFCELPDGTAITTGSVLDHLDTLPIDDEERAILAELFDKEGARSSYDHFVQTMYILPGHVVSYP